MNYAYCQLHQLKRGVSVVSEGEVKSMTDQQKHGQVVEFLWQIAELLINGYL